MVGKSSVNTHAKKDDFILVKGLLTDSAHCLCMCRITPVISDELLSRVGLLYEQNVLEY